MPILQTNDQQFQGSSTRRHFEAFNLLDTEYTMREHLSEIEVNDLHWPNCCGLILSTDILQNMTVGATRRMLLSQWPNWR